MSDRGNIIVKDGDDVVHLYTHWTGSDLPDVLREALRRGRDRWDDHSYLARIIFCEMVMGDEEGTTGFGISAKKGDDGTDITVDVENQVVRHGRKETSFKDYAAIKEE
jgi:hypothetical protein